MLKRILHFRWVPSMAIGAVGGYFIGQRVGAEKVFTFTQIQLDKIEEGLKRYE
jgi:hypothetical protein